MINEYFLRVFEQAQRQGPGSERETLLALSQCKELPRQASILDIGCGKGAQSIVLARANNGVVLSLDMHKPFLNALAEQVNNLALRHKVIPMKGNMSELPFTENQFDLIWSEGAIYIMGYKEALKDWKRYIKPGGYLVFTDCVWLQDNPPAELAGHWKSEKIELSKIEDIVKHAEEEKYSLINHFTLSERAWKEEFYDQIAIEVTQARIDYKGNEEAQSSLDSITREIEIFDTYNSYFGYEFFILQA